jgi:alkanesulfonate monooxygenase SsuD/methylene tetrahydromethanopterin reductase-like flavin-dependent oxidoreductase (luciferase family)
VQQGDPIQTAKLVAPVDQVSNARFLFGVGGGWNQDEMEDHLPVFDRWAALIRHTTH